MAKELTKKEEVRLIELLRKVPKFPNSPHAVFMELIKISPSVVVEVLLTNNGGKSIYLTYRRDEYFEGWHTPGGFLGFTENFTEGARRIAKKEIGVDVKNIQIVGLLSYDEKVDPRSGHLIAVACLAEPMGEPEGGRYFEGVPEERHLIQVELIFNLLKKNEQ